MVPTIQYLRDYGRRILSTAAPSVPGAEREQHEQAAALDADLLLAWVLAKPRLAIVTGGGEPVAAEQQEQYNAVIKRRSLGEPVAYIIGEKEFFGREFVVTPAVLVPRPETELLVEQALLRLRPEDGPFNITDIGTGSGAILLSILAELSSRFRPDILDGGRFVAVDLSREALEIARLNCSRLGLEGRVEFVQSDLLEQPQARQALGLDGTTLVVSNPPYIPVGDVLPKDVADFEPHTALFSGADGLDIIRRMASSLTRELSNGVALLVECGMGQAPEVERIFAAFGATTTRSVCDLAQIQRVVCAN
jgi:release factor glutamine methyltransferase